MRSPFPGPSPELRTPTYWEATCDEHGVFHVLFAMHSSYRELTQVVETLQPTQVFPLSSTIEDAAVNTSGRVAQATLLHLNPTHPTPDPIPLPPLPGAQKRTGFDRCLMKLQSLCRRRTYHSPSRQAFKLHAGSEPEATEAAVTEADDSGGLGGVDNSMADWEEGGRLFYKLQGLDKAARKEDYYDPEATT